MTRILLRAPLAIIVVWCGVGVGLAQVTTGLPPFGSFGGGPFDTVNLANLNVHLQIPIINKPGRGLPFYYSLAYDSAIWYPAGSQGSQTWTYINPTWGWSRLSDGSTGYIGYSATTTNGTCSVDHQFYSYTTYVYGPYTDAAGTNHGMFAQTVYSTDQNCKASVPTATYVSSDGSGYTLNVTNTVIFAVYTASGTKIIPTEYASTRPSGEVTDTNGNSITVSTTNGVTTYQDTLGDTALTVSGPSNTSSPVYLCYPGGSGNGTCYSGGPTNTVHATLNYAEKTVQTAFG
ncbi:MAG TPA: hypothetical protein VGZ29_07555 [Terriglobia bacterium]|nr:hypothetical protein [Terriglobia bacterium]